MASRRLWAHFLCLCVSLAVGPSSSSSLVASARAEVDSTAQHSERGMAASGNTSHPPPTHTLIYLTDNKCGPLFYLFLFISI